MRVLLTGGGTGGHVNPALAIADVIRMNHPDAEIAFVGTSRGIENSLVKKEGYPIYHVEIEGIRRSLSPANLKAAYRILTAPGKAEKLIGEFRPDIVIGTGGYVCWPTLKAAAKLGVPTMVHESNALPGMAVRRLQGSVDRILINFDATAEKLKPTDRIVKVGNPVRAAFSATDKQTARKKLGIPDTVKCVILSFGGSKGATTVNRAAIEIMRKVVADNPEVMHVHAAGSREYVRVKQDFAGYGLERRERLVLREYIYDMPLWMAAADVVLCRSGAMTLTELAMMKKAAVLIPSPNVVADHQYENAKVLADAGAAVLIREPSRKSGEQMNYAAVTQAVERLVGNPQERRQMEEAVGAFAYPDAGKRIYEEMMRVIAEKKKS